MVYPSKYEDLNYTPLVISAYIIKILKKGPQNFENLYDKLVKKYKINLNIYYNCLTFLWLSEIIYLEDYSIGIKK